MQAKAISLLLIATSLRSSSAFAPQASHCSQSASSTSTALQVGISFDEDDTPKSSQDYHQLYQRADACAHDDECSLEEWDAVMAKMEYIAEKDSAALESMMQKVHQLEKRYACSYVYIVFATVEHHLTFFDLVPFNYSSALSPWTSSTNLPIIALMFLASTYSTLTASSDEIVIRIGWFFQDWSQMATQSSGYSPEASHVQLFMCAAAAYVSVSEVMSCFLPSAEEKE